MTARTITDAEKRAYRATVRDFLAEFEGTSRALGGMLERVKSMSAADRAVLFVPLPMSAAQVAMNQRLTETARAMSAVSAGPFGAATKNQSLTSSAAADIEARRAKLLPPTAVTRDARRERETTLEGA